MLKQKLNAGALQLTLFIAVIIALLLTTFILLVHTHKKFKIQNGFLVETITNANLGIAYSLSNNIDLGDTLMVNNLNEDYKTVKVHKEFWGVFEKVISVSKIKTNTFKKIALIGTTKQRKNRPALYVQDNNKPLVVVGNTKIEGVAYLPRQGVKPGTISGKSYNGSQFIYGTSRISNQLPRLSKEWLQYAEGIYKLKKQFSQNQIIENSLDLKYSNSFLIEAKLVYSLSDIVLNNCNLIGNIIIQSESKIIISSASKLKDVILIAPEIVIENRVKGNFQAFASKSLIVNEYVELDYPTSLVLIEKQRKSTIQNDVSFMDSKLIIANNCKIKGNVIFIGQPKNSNYESQVEFKENSALFGELYCNQNIELRGSVFGSVYANNFIAKQSGSIYQNHIYNGTIIADELPQEYVGVLFESSKKGIAKWLY